MSGCFLCSLCDFFENKTIFVLTKYGIVLQLTTAAENVFLI